MPSSERGILILPCPLVNTSPAVRYAVPPCPKALTNPPLEVTSALRPALPRTPTHATRNRSRMRRLALGQGLIHELCQTHLKLLARGVCEGSSPLGQWPSDDTNSSKWKTLDDHIRMLNTWCHPQGVYTPLQRRPNEGNYKWCSLSVSRIVLHRPDAPGGPGTAVGGEATPSVSSRSKDDVT